MRQAGRYHSHYQGIKKNSDFMTMCKDPNLACEITLGPIEHFNFDAAILFSDLLFPLEQLGMGLSYHSGPPTLEKRLSSLEDIKSISLIEHADNYYLFQKQALTLLKEKLSPETDLLGFIGAPFTLYSYAVEGKHSGNLTESKKGLYDGRFQGFMEYLLPELMANMRIQAEGGADTICLFDTAVGELDLYHFKKYALMALRILTKEFKDKFPDKKIIYYSKHTNLNYLREIQDPCIDALGIDWRINLSDALTELGPDYYIQGNLDPSLLHLPWSELRTRWECLWQNLTSNSSVYLDKWIAGLGHGVLPQTPEENVKKSVAYIHEHFHPLQ